MERHLMDRDREGQLYLEARRQQAAVDLLKNRTSFLSTITPPSSNPSSSASSLYHEPSAASSSSLPSSSARQQQQQGAGATTISTTTSNNIISLPNIPASPFTNMSPAATTQLQQQAQALAPLGISPSSSSILPTPPHSSATATTTTATTTALSLAPSLQISVPIIKKTRQRAATGPGRIRQERDNNNSKGFPDRPVLPISPSSLEYQLTASLLNYTPPSSSNVAAGGTSAAATHTPSSTSTALSRPRSRSRSKSRAQQQQQQQHQQHQLPQQLQQAAKTRRHTIHKDARIDTTRFSSRGTGHRQQQHPQQQHRHPLHKHNDSDGSNGSSNGSNSTSGGNNFNGISVQPMTPQEWTPTSLLGSYPPSPTTATAACALGPTSTSTSDLHHNPYFTSASLALPSHSAPKLLSVPLPPLPPSPPLPPLPPKSPKTLIAQYFPRSLPPPPSRGRPYGQREPIVAPTPFKTPTFGPALISQQQQETSSTTTHPDAPPLPSPSASFQYIPPADTSLASTSHAVHSPLHQHILNEGGGDNPSSDFSLSNRPSPNASLVGFQGSAVATPKMLPNQQQSARLPSDLDLISHNSRQHHQHQQQQQQHSRLPPARLACSTSSLHKVTSSDEQDEVLVSPLSVPGPATPILLFAPLRPRSPGPGHSLLGSGIRTTPSTTSLLNPPSPPSPTTLPTTPIYPRGLSSPSILGDNAQVVIRLHQKAVPYIRELVPGKETGPSILTGDNKETVPKAATAGGGGGGTSSTVAFVTPAPLEPPSTNTSRDLEMVLDEITGRLRTNRTSMDPWAYNLSPWDDKPLPPVRRERGSRYWVFRDQDGLVMGPILFLLGHIFPPLWWVGALYPRLEHPDDIAVLASERARAAEMEAFSASLVAASRAQTHQNQAQRRQEGCEDDDVRDRQNGMALQWLHRQLKTLGVTVASITLSSSSSSSKPQLDNSTSADNSSTIATFQMVQGTPSNREGSTLANVSTIHVPYPPAPTPMPPSILDTRGPWAAASGSSRASSLFEQRMAHDRKLLRYELDLRWRRINLLWSFASFLVAVCTVAIVYAVRK
ncbi:hypothetical protein BGX24_009635 [Mortierella sp. AD032]|nr:hypothetical protein BGX24_009635 [Mortierella sp. AD032]